ncbi:hypothetical protein THAOC_27720, partial [Thalassiosira oceanica]
MRRQWTDLDELGLRVLQARDADFGGATTASFMFGFSREVLVDGRSGSERPVPSPPRNVRRQLRHYVEGGDEPFAVSVGKSDVAAVDCVDRAVWFTHGSREAVRGEGLFPSHRPRALVLAPIYKWPSRFVLRQLALKEFVHLYQLPSTMDSAFDPKVYGPLCNWRVLPPFVNSPTPVMYASLIRQLWGSFGGGEPSDDSSAAGNDDRAGERVMEGDVVAEDDVVRAAVCSDVEKTVRGEEVDVAVVVQANVEINNEVEVVSVPSGGQRMTNIGDAHDVSFESEHLPTNRDDKTSILQSDDFTSDEDELSVTTNDSCVNEIWNFELCERALTLALPTQTSRAKGTDRLDGPRFQSILATLCDSTAATSSYSQWEMSWSDAEGSMVDTADQVITLLPFAKHTTDIPEFDVLKQTLTNKGSCGLLIDSQRETMRRMAEEKQHRQAQEVWLTAKQRLRIACFSVKHHINKTDKTHATEEKEEDQTLASGEYYLEEGSEKTGLRDRACQAKREDPGVIIKESSETSQRSMKEWGRKNGAGGNSVSGRNGFVRTVFCHDNRDNEPSSSVDDVLPAEIYVPLSNDDSANEYDGCYCLPTNDYPARPLSDEDDVTHQDLEALRRMVADMT